jgi:hypothetical protein
VASTLNSFRNGAVGFIDWLDLFDVKLEVFETFVIKPKLQVILAFRIAVGNLNVLNVE